MTAPAAEQQLAFLTNLQRLLAEGQFTATYKYALLLSLADIAVESGDNSGESLSVPTERITEKFIQYYWRQVVPYVPRSDPAAGQVLRQNTGSQAAIIGLLLEARSKYDDSLADAKSDVKAWASLVSKVDRVVREMPLKFLQTIGKTRHEFLYDGPGNRRTITLRPGVAFCFRQFHALIGELVRSAWTRYIRRHNHHALGTTSDLSEFLFGSERADLSAVRMVLEEAQSGCCFYCERSLPRRVGHVDHFIPWSKYPVDLGHNFVLAHQSCNAAKSDHLAAGEFLAAWAARNVQHREQLAAGFDQRSVLHDLPTSLRIANWAYSQTFEAGGLVWTNDEGMVPLKDDWTEALRIS